MAVTKVKTTPKKAGALSSVKILRTSTGGYKTSYKLGSSRYQTKKTANSRAEAISFARKAVKGLATRGVSAFGG